VVARAFVPDGSGRDDHVSERQVGDQRPGTADRDEDSTAETDANFVMTGTGGLVEIQGTAEGAPFSRAEMAALVALGEGGVATLVDAQRHCLGIG